uniref:Putative addiction module component, TIGR02574 family n=1 Tax=Candidatus Kentrum sp. FW TaxID=2126338 RepID=A0A450SNE4_9GAMM|nr:MAG: putative addiction module component, TIGR02574 family [Candidatus Kentron sp. FW]VFJ56363.1 MAG: putative addiction module component, TIGR02574 family [Candidatus Kentron sp. FW]
MNPNDPPATGSSITARLIADLPVADIPMADRIRLLEDIGDSIAMESAPLPMTDTQKAELDRRLDAYASDGIKGRPADEAIKDIRGRLRR